MEWSGALVTLTAMNRSYDGKYQAASIVGDYLNHGRVRKTHRVDSNLNMRPLYTPHTFQMRVRGWGRPAENWRRWIEGFTLGFIDVD